MKRLLPAISGFASIQRLEKPVPKIYYAPEWNLRDSGRRDANPDKYSPMYNYGMSPAKWQYLNKVVWPPNHVVSEIGVPKSKEVFHCRESIHIHPKKLIGINYLLNVDKFRIFAACMFAKNMMAGEAVIQLRHKETKPTLLVAELIEETIERAEKEFKVNNSREDMFVAEAFAIQCKIIKGSRLSALYKQPGVIHYRYVNLFVRLQEGEPPTFNGRQPLPNGWDKMQDYYAYLRSRDFKYSI